MASDVCASRGQLFSDGSMSRTIGKHRPLRSPPGDTVCLCSYCGAAFYRSEMFRDASGNLCCPDDADGLDVVTLSLGNAEAASNKRSGRYVSVVDGTFEQPNTVPYPGFVSPDGHKGTF
jgi:hypothetical protein